MDFLQWLPYGIVVLLTAVPSWMLMRRVGASPGWVLLCLIPLGFVFVIGVAAFRLSDRLAGVENAMRNKGTA
jgi:hypothetical protein